MDTLSGYDGAFVAFALASQCMLVLFFAARRWRTDIERRWGWVVYALGVPAAILAVWYVLAAQPWYTVLAFTLFALWTAFGATVDRIRPIDWRSPPRPRIMAVYLLLYIDVQFAFWIPLWRLSLAAWIAFTALYIVNTVLNLSTHEWIGRPPTLSGRPTH